MTHVLSSWKQAFHLPTAFQQECGNINNLGVNPVGNFHLRFPTCQLPKIFLGSTASSKLTLGTVNTSPYGRERLTPEGSLPKVGIVRHGQPCVVILALDLGTHTGWALHQRDGTIISGTQHFTPSRFEGGGMRFLRFKHWLTETEQAAETIDAVFFEEVRRHAGVDAAHAYGGFLAHLTAWCEHHSIPYRGVPVATIKKHATGKGNADKDAMIAAIRNKGFSPSDDNEADALALLDWALRHGGVA